MTVTEYLEISENGDLRRYIRDMANALIPTDRFGQAYLQEQALARVSLMSADSDKYTVFRMAAQVMLERSEPRDPERRRARAIVRKYLV
jgi:hypothetical protein